MRLKNQFFVTIYFKLLKPDICKEVKASCFQFPDYANLGISLIFARAFYWKTNFKLIKKN